MDSQLEMGVTKRRNGKLGNEKWETADFSVVLIVILAALLASKGVNEGAK